MPYPHMPHGFPSFSYPRPTFIIPRYDWHAVRPTFDASTNTLLIGGIIAAGIVAAGVAIALIVTQKK